MKLSEYVRQVINDPKYGSDLDWVRLNLSRGHLERIEAAHDAEVLREAATALEPTIRGLNPASPVELAYINCTRIDAQELRHRAERIERGNGEPRATPETVGVADHKAEEGEKR